MVGSQPPPQLLEIGLKEELVPWQQGLRVHQCIVLHLHQNLTVLRNSETISPLEVDKGVTVDPIL